MRLLIYTCLTIGSLLGSWLGSLIDHSWFGFWSITLGAVGAFLGIWLGWQVGKNL